MTLDDFTRKLAGRSGTTIKAARRFVDDYSELVSDLLRDGEDVRIQGVGKLSLVDYSDGSLLGSMLGGHRRWHHGELDRCDICRKVDRKRMRAVKFTQSAIMRGKIYGVDD